MNIFFVDINPVIAAQSLCDKHVVKMVLESAQLLCNAHHISTTHVLPDRFYKLTHRNHPMSLWVNEHYKNYSWLCKHAIGLLDEYTYRYGKIHASTEIIYWCNQHFPNFPIFIDDDVQTITNPPQCMPQEYQIPNKPIEAYRQYYIKNKLNSIKCKWTKRKKPYWIGEDCYAQN